MKQKAMQKDNSGAPKLGRKPKFDPTTKTKNPQIMRGQIDLLNCLFAHFGLFQIFEPKSVSMSVKFLRKSQTPILVNVQYICNHAA